MMVIPYLSFRGNCEEAFNLYISVFGGRILHLSRYTIEAGGAELAGKVMHVEAKIGAGIVSGSDHSAPVQNSDVIRLMIHCDTAEQAQRYCDKLSAGGQQIQRLIPHPPPDDDGMGALVREAYGYCWIITAPNDGRHNECS